MNALVEFLNLWGERAIGLAGPMLWQSSLLIAVLFAFDFAFRRTIRASVRYALWLVVFVKLLLPPSLALPTSLAWWIRPAHAVTTPTKQEHTTTFLVAYKDVDLATAPTPIAPVFVPPPKPSLLSAGWAVMSWGAICAGLFAWMLLRWWQVARDVRRATCASERLKKLLAEAQAATGVSRKVELRLTTRAMSPAVCGLFRPVILLPQSLDNRLSAEQLRAVLLHELIHLLRGDVWGNCLQALLQMFYWWHPLLWLANARIRRVREEAVDDAVMLALADKAETYAPTLLEVAKLAFNRPLTSLGLVGILESRNALRQRIERLVDFRPPRKAGLTIASALCLLAFAALAVPMGERPIKPVASPTSDNTSTQPADGNPKAPPTKFWATEVEASALSEQGLMVYDTTTQIATITNGGCVKFKGIILTADSITINYEAKEITAEGHVRIGRENVGNGFWFADRVNITLDDRAVTVAGSGLIAEQYAEPAHTDTNKPQASFPTEGIETRTNLIRARSFEMKLYPERSNGSTNSSSQRRIAFTIQTNQPSKSLNGRNDSATTSNSPTFDKLVHASNGRERIVAKLDSIRLNSVSYHGAALEKVVHDLNNETKILDLEGNGINFIINPPVQPTAQSHVDPTTGLPLLKSEFWDVATMRITIDPPLSDVRLVDALDAIVAAGRGHIKYTIEDYAVVFSPKVPEPERLYTRTFRFDPNRFYTNLVTLGFLNELPPDQQPGPLRDTSRTDFMQKASLAFQNYFSSLGVDLNPLLGKSMFWKWSGMLLMRATKQDLDTVGEALAGMAPPSNGAAIMQTNRLGSTSLQGGRAEAAALVQNARLLLEEGKLDKAEAGLEKALAVEPANSAAHYYLSLVRERRSRSGDETQTASVSSPTNAFLGTSQSKSFYDDQPSPRHHFSGQVGMLFKVEVREDGSYRIGSDQMDLKQLRARLAETKQGNQSIAVHVDADKNASMASIVALTTVLKELNVSTITMSTNTNRPSVEPALPPPNAKPKPQIQVEARFVELTNQEAWPGLKGFFGNAVLKNRVFTNSAGTAPTEAYGILTDPQYRVVLRAWEQRSGIDFLSAPGVTTLSGRQAQIQVAEARTVVTRISPQALIPPGISDGPDATDQLYQTSPMHFGPVLDVTPHLSDDGYTISLNVTAAVTEFLGYDSNSNSVPAYINGRRTQVTVPLPKFRSREVTVFANVWDGQTLFMGNSLEYVTSKKLNGEIETQEITGANRKPFAVFVTVRLVDEAGKPIHTDDEMPFATDSIPPQAPSQK